MMFMINIRISFPLILARSRLGLLHIVFAHLLQMLWCPWLISECRFHPISWERIDRIWPNFVCALILTISRLGLLPAIFRKVVTELWPLIDVRFSRSLEILRTNWYNFTKFYICIFIDKIYVRIVTHQFWHIGPCLMLGFRVLDILRTNGQNFTKFYIYYSNIPRL